MELRGYSLTAVAAGPVVLPIAGTSWSSVGWGLVATLVSGPTIVTLVSGPL